MCRQNDESQTNLPNYFETLACTSGGQESFKNPRAVTSLKLFNGFRVLTEKSHNPEELKTHIETLAFKPLSEALQCPRVVIVPGLLVPVGNDQSWCFSLRGIWGMISLSLVLTP